MVRAEWVSGEVTDESSLLVQGWLEGLLKPAWLCLPYCVTNACATSPPPTFGKYATLTNVE